MESPKSISKGFTDIHTHILPHIDDGSNSVQKTIEMIEMQYDEGVRNIICTPHYGFWNPNYKKEIAWEIYLKIKAALKNYRPDMNLYMGNEIFYTSGIVNDVIEGRASTIADSSYVLLEFNPYDDYDRLELAVREFTQRGYKPILAHIERYECLDLNEDRVDALIAIGAYMQVNSSTLVFSDKGFSLSRRDRQKRRKNIFITQLLNNGKIHFIGSDCHNTTSRPPRMADAARRIELLAGIETCEKIMFKNIQSVINNERI